MTFFTKQTKNTNTKQQQQRDNKTARANRVQRARAGPSARQKSAPVAKSRLTKTRAPNMRTRANGATISHREYIGDVNGSALFTSTAYAVNPGNPAVFPWLSQIAQRYESYVFHSLHFEFETVSSTLTAGSVMMACDYDAADSAPADKQILMSYAQATRGAPWQESRFHARSGDLTKFTRERYVRGAATPTGDIKTYDVANFFLATQGMADATAVGELYVSYQVELRTPQLGVPLSVTPNALAVTHGSSTTMLGGDPTFSTNPWSAVATATGVNLSGVTVGSTLCVSFYATGTSMGNNALAFTGATNVTTQTLTNPGATLTVHASTWLVTSNAITIVPDTISGVYSVFNLVISEAQPFP